jgi:hypothetical protein
VPVGVNIDHYESYLVLVMLQNDNGVVYVPHIAYLLREMMDVAQTDHTVAII